MWYAPNLPSLPEGIEFDSKLLEDIPEEYLDPDREIEILY
jgi:hypothetical protein